MREDMLPRDHANSHELGFAIVVEREPLDDAIEPAKGDTNKAAMMKVSGLRRRSGHSPETGGENENEHRSETGHSATDLAGSETDKKRKKPNWSVIAAHLLA